MLTSGLYAIPALLGAFLVVPPTGSARRRLAAAVVAAGGCFALRMARRALRHRRPQARPAPNQAHDGAMTGTAAADVLDGLDAVRAWQEDFYRDLHQHPELSHQEQRTAAEVAERLRDAGYEVHERDRRHRRGRRAAQRRRADRAAARRHGRASGPRGRPACPTPAPQTADGRQRGAGDARLRARRPRHLPARRRARCSPTARDRWTGTLVAAVPARRGDRRRRPGHGRRRAGRPRRRPSTSRSPSTCCRSRPGTVGTRPGPTLSAADSMRITVHGRGAHGSMPQAAVDPVVLAAMIVVRLQTVVSREIAPGRHRGAHRRQHPGRHQEQRHPRPRRAAAQRPHLRRAHPHHRSWTRSARIVRAECQASGSPEGPGVRAVRPLPAHRQRRRRPPTGSPRRSRDFFGDRAGPLPQQTASEDFSDIPTALGVPYTYWGIGGIDPDAYRAAERPAGSPRTSRSTTPPPSPPSSSPPSTPAPRRWSSPPWPGWH